MIIDLVKFSKEFFVLGAGEWVTFGGTLEPGDDPIECIKELKQKMISMYGGEALTNNFIPEVQYGVKANGVDLGEAIQSCDSIKTLESYKLLIKTRPDLRKVYDEKMSELLK